MAFTRNAPELSQQNAVIRYRSVPAMAASGFGIPFATLIAALVAWTLAKDGPRPGLALVALGIYGLFQVAWRGVFDIRLDLEQQVCEFRTLARRVMVPVKEIEAIDNRNFDLRLRYEGGGKLEILQPVQGLHDLIARLKDLNPDIAVAGI